MGLAASEVLIDSDLPGLKLISKGKVRDIYETSDPNRLLFVASDRISAYDVVLKNVRAPNTPPGAGSINGLLHPGRPWKG
jgi:phosphoribosylaminoimidazole-succinocarboxamide synthase